jgi:transcriptional regulator with XRE-family HTH domain
MVSAREVERLIDSLVAIRRGLGISQTELAEAMETTQSAVSTFERAGADPRISTLQRYASTVNPRIRLAVEAPEGLSGAEADRPQEAA